MIYHCIILYIWIIINISYKAILPTWCLWGLSDTTFVKPVMMFMGSVWQNLCETCYDVYGVCLTPPLWNLLWCLWGLSDTTFVKPAMMSMGSIWHHLCETCYDVYEVCLTEPFLQLTSARIKDGQLSTEAYMTCAWMYLTITKLNHQIQ